MPFDFAQESVRQVRHGLVGFGWLAARVERGFFRDALWKLPRAFCATMGLADWRDPAGLIV